MLAKERREEERERGERERRGTNELHRSFREKLWKAVEKKEGRERVSLEPLEDI